jgi:hypothetical protein
VIRHLLFKKDPITVIDCGICITAHGPSVKPVTQSPRKPRPGDALQRAFVHHRAGKGSRQVGNTTQHRYSRSRGKVEKDLRRTSVVPFRWS